MLFKTTAELLSYTDTVASVKLNDVKNTINFIDQKILQPILGTDLFKELNDGYNQATQQAPLTEELLELLEYSRRVVGPFVCFYYLPKASVQLSAAGAQRTEGTTNKTTYKYQDVAFLAQQLAEGEAACESLLTYLYANTEKFNNWTSNKVFKKFQSLFIKTGDEFNEHYTTAQPFRNYHAMRFKMPDVELSIKKAITPALFKYLKEKDADQSYEWTESETELMVYLKKAICYFTVSFALPHINVRLDGDGFTVASDSSGGVMDQEKRKPAEKEKIEMLQASCNDAGSKWLAEALEFIVANAADFEAWEKPEKVEMPKSGNECLGGVFGLV